MDRDQALRTVLRNSSYFRADFHGWLHQNWGIWQEFERRAMRVARLGRTRFSARTITESIRWDTALREDGGVFKINDHFPPDMARLFQVVHPEYAGLFEMRDRTATYRQPDQAGCPT